jgi:ABC-2 type transport system permease protein
MPASYLRLWRRFVVLAVVREAEYRLNFVISVLEGLAQLGLAVVAVALLYRYTDEISGWSAAEALLLLGIYRAMDGLLALQIAPNLMRIPGYVGRGDLDYLLLRPVASQFLVSLRWLNLPEAANVLIGLGVAVYAGQQAGVAWSPAGVLAAALLAACGLVVLYSLWLGSVTLAFWLIDVEPLGYLFYDLWQTARYPVGYFKGLLRAVLTFVLPVAFATTFPAQALLGAIEPGLLLTGVGLAALALFGAHRFWRYAVQHYASASS